MQILSMYDYCIPLTMYMYLLRRMWIVYLSIVWMGSQLCSATASSPSNLTVYRVGATEAILTWWANVNYGTSYFELTYEIPNYPVGIYRVVRGIDRNLRRIVLWGLYPMSPHTAYMVTVDYDGGRGNQSNEVTFTTRDDIGEVGRSAYTPHLGELLVVGVVLVIWALAVMMFLRRWASIRILQPMEPRYKHNPKNLDQVKIVKKAQDSVIYKSYSRKLSVTMVAREKKRFQRMHTIAALPTIEMERAVAEM